MANSSWSWARREIAQLDTHADAQRIAHLSFEVRFGAPIFLHALFNIAFVYNVGIPAIANILYRNGSGAIMKKTRKRNFDSMIFFGELYKHGDSPEGIAICDRLNRIHANFPIPNELSLYTLSTLACLPYRVGRRFSQHLGPSDKEHQAQFLFWRRMGELLNIQDIPDSLPAFLRWMHQYEERQLSSCTAGREIFRAQAEEWAQYWFPPALQNTALGIFLHLVEPEVRQKMGLGEPSALHRALGNTMIQGLFVSKALLADPQERSLVSFFAQNYATGDLAQVGVDAQ